MSIPRFSVRNSVLVNMVMILIIAMGTYALITLPMELFPQVKLNRVIIRVAFPGASPEEVEKLDRAMEEAAGLASGFLESAQFENWTSA